ncbi:hypothetical protein [uncultured Duncaniella sp.]|uniref:hypothetical protein n=1 Tax=uncultured Duncaniella sp. TaxID=2768039 RepID=UPI0025A9A4F8|nr:hypothetical protein [uncultured Duncaniella sp.]
MKTIELDRETLVAVYNNSNAIGRKTIKEQLGEKFSEILPITNRVKTLKDAMEELGEEHEAVKVYRSMEWNLRDTMPDIKAYLQLRIITAALNEGWEPQFIDGEYRWYTWYELHTKEEIDRMDEKEKKRLVLLDGRAYASSCCGLRFSTSRNASSYSFSSFGSHLVFKSQELAEYASKQFIKIYADFCFLPKEKESK